MNWLIHNRQERRPADAIITARQECARIIERLAARGCDPVALACTEIETPLLLPSHACPLPLGHLSRQDRAFLSSCEALELPGTYRFRPDTQRPANVPRYPPDADDTALVSLALLRHQVATRQQLRRLVAHTILSHRVLPGDRPARWVQAGAFMTWLDRDWPYNIVDCIVNANMVRLICAVGPAAFPAMWKRAAP